MGDSCRATERLWCRARVTGSSATGGLILLIIGLAAISCAGCRKEVPEPTDLRWDIDIRPIFERTCTPCHSRADSLKGPNAHGLNLEGYGKVRRNRKKIYETVVVEKTMPGPNTAGIKLSDEEVRKIGEWLRGNAPR